MSTCVYFPEAACECSLGMVVGACQIGKYVVQELFLMFRTYELYEIGDGTYQPLL